MEWCYYPHVDEMELSFLISVRKILFEEGCSIRTCHAFERKQNNTKIYFIFMLPEGTVSCKN